MNDESLLPIHSPQLAKHFIWEMDRLWDTAELGITPNLRRKPDRQMIRCGGSRTQTTLGSKIPETTLKPRRSQHKPSFSTRICLPHILTTISTERNLPSAVEAAHRST